MSQFVLTVEPLTRERIGDVLVFERELRRQEPDTYFMDAGESYQDLLERSFEDSRFTKIGRASCRERV